MAECPKLLGSPGESSSVLSRLQEPASQGTRVSKVKCPALSKQACDWYYSPQIKVGRSGGEGEGHGPGLPLPGGGAPALSAVWQNQLKFALPLWSRDKKHMSRLGLWQVGPVTTCGSLSFVLHEMKGLD